MASSTVVLDDEEHPRSFLPPDFEYVPNRDLEMTPYSLFDHLTKGQFRNPMTTSSDPELPSFKDAILDLLSSKQAWCDAIDKQRTILDKNKIELRVTMRAMTSVFTDHITDDNLTPEIYGRLIRPRLDYARELSLRLLFQSQVHSRFVKENRELLTIHESDADEPFDIFQVKLPIWEDGEDKITWTSLYDILTKILFDDHNKASPTLPPPESFSCTRYLGKLFQNSTIARHTPLQSSSYHPSLQKIMNRIRSRTPTRSYWDAIYRQGVDIPDSSRSHYSTIGKTRYTLSIILRWIELTHQLLFCDQISHSIMYHFYRNIHTIPTTILTGGGVKRYVNANIRKLTKDNMPVEEDDPVLLVPFEEGQDVYKMKCCKKDISMETIEGIVRSGRTPKCPMCRAELFTMDSDYPLDPTYEPPKEIRVIENCPSYLVSPYVPPSTYARDVFERNTYIDDGDRSDRRRVRLL